MHAPINESYCGLSVISVSETNEMIIARQILTSLNLKRNIYKYY